MRTALAVAVAAAASMALAVPNTAAAEAPSAQAPSAQAPSSTSPSAITAAPDVDVVPGRGGWEQLAKGVFVNTKIGNPDLITKAGKARNGKNVGLRVDQTATAHRVLRNGQINLIDTSEDGKITIPGSRVHPRGALMFITTPTQTRATGTTGEGTWVYIDTNASINNRNRLIGASWGGDAWRAARPSDEVALKVTNATATDYQIKFLDRSFTALPPGSSQSARYYSDSPGADDVSGQILTPSGQTIYIGGRNPLFGSPRATFGSTTHIFDTNERCYFSSGGLYAETLMKTGSGQSNYWDVTMKLLDSAPDGIPACSSD